MNLSSRIENVSDITAMAKPLHSAMNAAKRLQLLELVLGLGLHSRFSEVLFIQSRTAIEANYWD
jgi:hypothetical protein